MSPELVDLLRPSIRLSSGRGTETTPARHKIRLQSPLMTERPLDPWMTSSRGPFRTRNAGGQLGGIVTITALPEHGAHLIVEAHWKTIHGEPRTVSAAIEGYNAARALAHEWAARLAAGREPEPT